MSGLPFAEQPELHTAAPHRAALLIYPGNLKQALKDAKEDRSKTLIGLAHGIPSVFVTKVLASTKPDFIWIDVEHGMFNRLTLHDAIHAAQYHSEGKAMVIVRVPKHDEVSLSTALDAGAAGIVIPHVETAEEVKKLIKDMYYGPKGQRSFSPWAFAPGISDASLYPDDSFNLATSNKHICVMPQIESVKGMENIDEIASVEGVDALMLGPVDYMIDAGIPFKLGGIPDPRFLETLGKFMAAAKRHNVAVFGAAQTVDLVPMLIQQGYSAIAVAFDAWGLANLCADALKKGREAANEVAATATPS